MPTYTVKDPETGRTVKLTGDSPPTEAELEEIFSSLPPMEQQPQAQQAQPEQQPQPQPQPRQQVTPDQLPAPPPVAGGLGALTMGVPEGVENVIGGLDALYSGYTNIGADTAKSAAQAGLATPMGMLMTEGVNKIRGGLGFDELTDEEIAEFPTKFTDLFRYEAKTKRGKEFVNTFKQGVSNAIEGTVIEDVGEAMSDFAQAAEDKIYDETGSRVLAKGLVAAPTVAAEIYPFLRMPKKYRASNGAPTTDDIADAFLETPQDVQKLRKMRDDMYNELKDGGYGLKGGALQNTIQEVMDELELEGVDITGGRVAAKVNAMLKKAAPVDYVVGKYKFTRHDPMNKIEEVKRILYKDYGTLEGADKAVVNDIFHALEDKLDDVIDQNIVHTKGKGVNRAMEATRAKEIIKSARDLGGRVRRADFLNEVFKEADLRGVNGMKHVQLKLRQILDKKHARKFYSPAEQQLMRDIVKGTVEPEIGTLRLLGRTGAKALVPAARLLRAFGDDKYRRMPLVVRAKAIAKFASGEDAKIGRAFNSLQNMVLAGKTGQEAVVRYLKAVPKSKRDYVELGQILANSKYDLNDIDVKGVKLRQQALEVANGIRAVRGTLAMTAVGNREEEENEPIY